jgi:hypothetical protein
VDWGEIWPTVEKINPEEWETLRNKLKLTYQRLDKLFRTTKNWDDEDVIGARWQLWFIRPTIWVKFVRHCAR